MFIDEELQDDRLVGSGTTGSFGLLDDLFAGEWSNFDSMLPVLHGVVFRSLFGADVNSMHRYSPDLPFVIFIYTGLLLTYTCYILTHSLE